MMETKLWVALCALLLAHLGSAVHDDDHTVASNATKNGGSEAAPESPAAEPKPTSNLDPILHAVTPPSPNDTNPSAGINATTITLAPEPKKENGTSIISPSEATSLENNQTHSLTSQPPVPPSESHAPTAHIPLNSTAISSTPPTNTSHVATVTPPDSTLPPNETTQTQTFTHGPTPESPKPESTTNATGVQSTSSTSSSEEPHSPESHTLTTLHSTLEPVRHPETSSVAHQTPTTTSATSSTTQTKPHAETPSQLNVGGDTTMVHEAPTLDPLLAALVSAFIITAVIIALLLFLKLRRRDNRPEFRRLQDLPMDDMMEDTPLSMYSY